MLCYACMLSEYERRAFELLDELYKTHRGYTELLVKRPLETWHKTSVYKLAFDADFTYFNTHNLFQARLDEMWYGSLETNLPSWKVRLRILSCITNGWLTLN